MCVCVCVSLPSIPVSQIIVREPSVCAHVYHRGWLSRTHGSGLVDSVGGQLFVSGISALESFPYGYGNSSRGTLAGMAKWPQREKEFFNLSRERRVKPCLDG